MVVQQVLQAKAVMVHVIVVLMVQDLVAVAATMAVVAEIPVDQGDRVPVVRRT
jgi:hypothetical protein